MKVKRTDTRSSLNGLGYDDMIKCYGVMNYRDSRLGTLLILCTMMVSVLLLTGCGTRGDPPLEQNVPIDEAQPGSTQASDPSEDNEPSQSMDDISTLWQQSAHASTYVLDENNQNSTCARCHAPVNWIPSMDDMPESCSTCKFEIDPPPPVIAESEWTHIECRVCHQVKKDEVQPEIAWLEIAAIEEYAEVSSVTALCDHCHLAGEIDGHVSVIVAGDHATYACVNCHDAHRTEISCDTEGCHTAAMDGSEGIIGHDLDHTQVSCSACHDGSGLDVGPLEDAQTWATFLPGEAIPFASHQTQRLVDCERCHFDANPWSLSEVVAP